MGQVWAGEEGDLREVLGSGKVRRVIWAGRWVKIWGGRQPRLKYLAFWNSSNKF
jgi:hypothetical protein